MRTHELIYVTLKRRIEVVARQFSYQDAPSYFVWGRWHNHSGNRGFKHLDRAIARANRIDRSGY